MEHSDKGETHHNGIASEEMQKIAGRVQDTATKLASRAQAESAKLGEALHEKIDSTLSRVGSTISEVGGAIRERGSIGTQINEGVASVAHRVEQTGDYLSQGISGIGQDVSALVKKHPLATAMIGLGLGFLLGRSKLMCRNRE